MSFIQKLFENKKVNFSKLETFGFAKENNAYFYEKKLQDINFLIKIQVDKNGIISGKIIDQEFNDAFPLQNLENVSGTFNNKIKKEYETLLVAIAESCFEKNIFKTKQTNQIIDYVINKYKDMPEFLWDKFPNYAIFRKISNHKWYLLIAKIQAKSLKLKVDKEIEIINLKNIPSVIKELVEQGLAFSAYHMDKKSWMTIILNDSVDIQKIFQLIDQSYQLV